VPPPWARAYCYSRRRPARNFFPRAPLRLLGRGGVGGGRKSFSAKSFFFFLSSRDEVAVENRLLKIALTASRLRPANPQFLGGSRCAASRNPRSIQDMNEEDFLRFLQLSWARRIPRVLNKCG
jgi:hypothetical protein